MHDGHTIHTYTVFMYMYIIRYGATHANFMYRYGPTCANFKHPETDLHAWEEERPGHLHPVQPPDEEVGQLVDELYMCVFVC